MLHIFDLVDMTASRAFKEISRVFTISSPCRGAINHEGSLYNPAEIPLTLTEPNLAKT